MRKFSALFLFIAFISFTGLNFAQSNIGILGGIAFPMGNFSDAASTGFGFTGNYEYMVIPQLGITGSAGYFHFGGASATTQDLFGLGGVDFPSFNIIPIVVGARYYFIKGSVMPYGGLELGLYISSQSSNNNLNDQFLFKGNSLDNTTQSIDNTSSSTTSTNFGFAPYVGVRFLVSPHVGLEGNLKFTIITGGGAPETNANDIFGFGTTSSSSSSILHFGINAGVFFLL